MHDHDPSPQERTEIFGVPYTGPKCEACDGPVTRHGDTCTVCRKLALELEADVVWPFWLATLKTAWAAGDMDALDKKMGGWKYVGADVQRETHRGGISLGSANNLRFLAPGHKGFAIFTRQDDKMPTVTIQSGKDYGSPDWSATFTSGTPHEIILAAAHAVIHQN